MNRKHIIKSGKYENAHLLSQLIIPSKKKRTEIEYTIFSEKNYLDLIIDQLSDFPLQHLAMLPSRCDRVCVEGLVWLQENS